MLAHRLRFFARKFDLGFRPTDLVLDVGSGNDPHPRADLLCDKFVLDDAEREGRLVVDRPLVGGELERLPFRDGSIDFIIASHVLEHVEDPLRAVAELARVGKRGYIETPAEFGGKLMDLPGHRWYVRKDGETLVFTGKSVAMYDMHLNVACFSLWGAKDRSWMAFYWDHPELFFMRHRWEGKIDCQVVPPPAELFQPEEFFHASVDTANLEKAQAGGLKGRLKNGIRGYYQSRLYGPPRSVDLASLCACPACQGALTFEAERVVCQGCARRYPFVSQGPARVPMLLTQFENQETVAGTRSR